MLINPSINIGIGNYGKCYIDSFHNFNNYRETTLSDYMSFYILKSVESGFDFSDIKKNKNSEKKSNVQLNSLLNQIYNENVNLANQLSKNIEYNSININLIISYNEQESISLLVQIVEFINRSYLSGSFGSINLKIIGTIFEEIENQTNLDSDNFNTTECLNKLKQLKRENDVLSNLIIIDDKNTKAVYLDINNISIGLVLNEFITHLMTNHYQMLGNFINPDFISIGIGLTYFDIVYAKKHFKKMIFEKYLHQHKLFDQQYLINLSDYNILKKDFLLDFNNGIFNDNFSAFKDLIASQDFPINKTNTFKDAKFLLSNLLGKHDDVKLENPISYHNFISIKEVTINLLNNLFKNVKEYEYIDMEELKSKKDELRSLVELKNKKISQSEKLLDRIKNLESNIEELEEQVDLNFITFKDEAHFDRLISKIKDKFDVFILGKTNKLEECKKKLKKEKKDYNDLNFVSKWRTKKAFQEQTSNLEHKILDLENQITNKSKEVEDKQTEFGNIKIILNDLYVCYSGIEKKYNLVNRVISKLLKNYNKFTNEFNSLNQLNYMFILNLLNEKGLVEYVDKNYIKHTKDMFSINDIAFQNIDEFLDMFNGILSKEADDKIVFDMIKYLNGDYKKTEFINNHDLETIDSFIQKNSLGFINVTNDYRNDSSHQLISCRVSNVVEQKTIDKLFSEFYNAGVPQKIEHKLPHKFGLMNIEIIDDLNHVVRYNKNIINEK